MYCDSVLWISELKRSVYRMLCLKCRGYEHFIELNVVLYSTKRKEAEVVIQVAYPTN